jgi:AsmA protein
MARAEAATFMKRPKQSMRRYTWALAVACFLIILLAAPLLFSDRYSRIALQSGAVFAASNNTYSLSSPVRLMSGPTIELESGTLSVPPNRTGLARGGQVIAMLITGGPPMTLDAATFTADFSAREPTFSQDTAGHDVAPLVKALQKMQFNGLVVRDSTVRIKMADGSVAELQNLDATIDSKPNGAILASGSFDFHGEKVAFDTVIGASSDTQGMSRPLSATINGAPLTATLDGSLMLGENPQLLSPQAEFKAADLRAAARWLGVNWPGKEGFGAFRAKGQLEWVGRNIAFQNAVLDLDDNNASGTFSINFAGVRPTVEGTIGLKALDLTQYWKSAEVAPGTADSLLTIVRRANGLEFPLIQAIDADFRISSDSLTLPATTIGRSAATVSLRSGKMLADIAELEFEDGTRGGGQIRIDMSGANPNYGVQAKFEVADVARPAQLIFGHPTVQGRGAVTVDLNATGNTGESLLGSLDGKLYVTLLEGGRVGLDINKLAEPEGQPVSSGTWQDVSARAISVDKLDARFTVNRGVVRTQAAEAVSGARALRAEGTISLIEQSLDMQLAVGDVAKPAADSPETGTTVLKLKPSEIIHVRGPWSAPAVRTGPPLDKAFQYGPPSPG